MTRRSGDVYALAMAIEDTPGVYKTPNVYIPFTSNSLDPGVTDDDLGVNVGTPGARYTYRKDAQPAGTVGAPAWPEAGLEHFLKMAFGSVATTRNIPSTGLSYTHLFSQDPSSMLTASIVEWADPLTAKEPIAYLGNMVNSFSIGYDGPGPITLSVDLKGSAIDLNQTAPTKTYTTARPFVWGDFSCKLDGVAVANATKAAIQIDKTVDSLSVGGTGFPHVNTPTGFGVSGHLEFPYEDWTELKKYISGTSTGTTVTSKILDRTLQLTTIGDLIETLYNYKMDFKLPRINMTLTDTKDQDGTEIYAMDFNANRYDGVDGGLGTGLIASASVVSQLVSVI